MASNQANLVCLQGFSTGAPNARNGLIQMIRMDKSTGQKRVKEERNNLHTVLHGPPILVDKTNFGLVTYNHSNFYPFEETSSYRSVK